VVSGRSSILSDELGAAVGIKVTRSEEEVLKMLARGMKYDEIAEHRKSSPSTVRKQCEVLLDKLLLDSRERLIAWAVQNGYGSLELDQ
jgi:DNA-binding NarL/FixJ family response regulator